MGIIILISGILYNTNFRGEDNSNRGYNFINQNFYKILKDSNASEVVLNYQIPWNNSE